jgi:hypothetical protein
MTNEEKLDMILRDIQQIKAMLPKAPPPVADDADLDGEWGAPAVRKDPKRWTGASYVGKKYSECPSDYLLQLAGLLDWQAGKDEEKGDTDSLKYAGYKRRDAARARGWAKRNAGKTFAPAASVNEPWNDQF